MAKLVSRIKRWIKRLGKPSSYRGYNYYSELLMNRTSATYFLTYFQRIHACKDMLNTELDFELKGETPFGTSIDAVKEMWGAPNHSVSKKRSYTSDVLLYRLHIGGHRAKCEMHFIDKKLFYYCYRFSYLSPAERKGLLDILEMKYLNGYPASLDGNQIIQDRRSNYLLIENKVEFITHYLSGDEVEQHLIECDLDIKTARYENRERRRHLELMYTL